jgi:hypothetical protein
LDSEAVLADIDADCGQRASIELEVDYRLHFVARCFAAVFRQQLLAGLECFFHLRWVQRFVKKAIGAGLEGLARPWPGSAGDSEQEGFLWRREQGCHLHDFLGAGQVKVHDQGGATAIRHQLYGFLARMAAHLADSKRG